MDLDMQLKQEFIAFKSSRVILVQKVNAMQILEYFEKRKIKCNVRVCFDNVQI